MAKIYTIKGNGNIREAQISDLGAAILKLIVKSKDGKDRDVVLGFDTVDEYKVNPAFFGAVVGPIANRTAKARFSINGHTYEMEEDIDEGINNLHTSREKGLHKTKFEDVKLDDNSISLTHRVEDMDDGFPGNRSIGVRYEIDGDTLRITYTLTTDRDTVFNPTNHSYFNLNGHDSGKIFGHTFKFNADSYTEVDEGLIPTGEFVPIVGSKYDFSEEKAFTSESAPIDHNFRRKDNDSFGVAASVYSPESGIRMTVSSDLPGIQVYTGAMIPTITGKGGYTYGSFSGVALETQFFPNCLNEGVHNPDFKYPLVKAGEDFKSVTEYRFEI